VKLKCNACGGIYDTVQKDGTEYYHACPPLSDVEVAAALGKNPDPTKWTPQDVLDVAAAPRARANARDENVVPPPKVNGKATIKAPGAGVVTVP